MGPLFTNIPRWIRSFTFVFKWLQTFFHKLTLSTKTALEILHVFLVVDVGQLLPIGLFLDILAAVLSYVDWYLV
jgi:hypothetical protein